MGRSKRLVYYLFRGVFINQINNSNTMNRKEEINAYLKELRLGDKLEWLFIKTGIKALVKFVYPNCGCDRRKEELNDLQIKIKRK